jgi:hypothetical protein
MKIQEIEKEFGKSFPELIEEYASKGKTSTEIAVCLGCWPGTIRKHAKINNIKLPGKRWQSKLVHGD